jgi:hypothetical protein
VLALLALIASFILPDSQKWHAVKYEPDQYRDTGQAGSRHPPRRGYPPPVPAAARSWQRGTQVHPGADTNYPAPVRMHVVAVASLVCSRVRMFVLFPLVIPGIVCVRVARAQIRRTGERGAGMALAGLILGYVGIVVAVVVVGAVIALVANANSN